MAERNPYYWKVDTEGNQLPYIDRLVFNIVGHTQARDEGPRPARSIYQGRAHRHSGEQAALLQNAQTADIRLIDNVGSGMNRCLSR